MKRVDLVKTLELVQPALAASGLVPVFGCFTFTKGHITAFNGDSLAIVAPFSNEMTFAVDGKTLLGLLQNTKAENVNMTVEKSEVKISAGKSIFKLPYFGKDEFLFDEPNEKWTASVNFNSDILEGIDICLTTTCRDQSMPAIMGICINLGENNLYSCDGDAITRVKIAGRVKGKGSFTVPNSFFDALLKITVATEALEGKIELTSNWAKATLANGFIIYGRVIQNDKPVDHEKLISKTMGDEVEFVKVPDELDEALSRARIIGDPETKPTVLTVYGGKLGLLTESALGEARDDMELKGHEDIEAFVHASLVQRALAICNKIAIKENCTAYQKGDNVLQVVANIGE